MRKQIPVTRVPVFVMFVLFPRLPKEYSGVVDIGR